MLCVTISVSFAVFILVLRANDRQELQQPLDSNSHSSHRPNVLGPARSNKIQQTSPHQTKIILYWTKFFETSDFEVGLGSKPFASCSFDRVNTASSISNCLTTTDRGLLNDSDAVIFHGRDLHVDDLPPPKWRRPHQMFIFFLLESPIHTNLDLLQQPVFRHYFNRTMTYRRDSDVVHAYGRLRCIDPASPSCLEFPRPANGSAAPFKTYPTAAASAAARVLIGPIGANVLMTKGSKNRTVAWFVSNCQSNSQRESLVRRLSQFIVVDIYGKCGDGNQKRQHSCPNRSECDEMLSRHYRFYLSFENSLCPDYVTEKLYRPLAYDTVPVVYGGADYSLYLPAGSYVDARDFESPEALADHLKILMANDTLYSSYFDWKSQYVVDQNRLDGWCRLCRLLWQQPSSISKDTIKAFAAIDDVASWWSGRVITNQTCSPPPKSLV